MKNSEYISIYVNDKIYKSLTFVKVMADNRIQMPSSGGGIISYSKDFHSKIEISPGTVIFLIILLIVLEVLLHTFGGGLLG